jgi:hypothetical protein
VPSTSENDIDERIYYENFLPHVYFDRDAPIAKKRTTRTIGIAATETPPLSMRPVRDAILFKEQNREFARKQAGTNSIGSASLSLKSTFTIPA